MRLFRFLKERVIRSLKFACLSVQASKNSACAKPMKTEQNADQRIIKVGESEFDVSLLFPSLKERVIGRLNTPVKMLKDYLSVQANHISLVCNLFGPVRVFLVGISTNKVFLTLQFQPTGFRVWGGGVKSVNQIFAACSFAQ